MRARALLLIAALLTAGIALPASGEREPGPADIGRFERPFAEPGKNCRTEKQRDGTKARICKPAGVSVVVLPGGRILYWDGLEATENIQFATAAEVGDAAVNDQSRVLDVAARRWAKPSPVDGGART